MAQHRDVTTDAEIDAALEDAKLHDNDPVAKTVQYVPRYKLLIVELTNGRRLPLPIEDLQGLENATAGRMVRRVGDRGKWSAPQQPCSKT